MAETPPETPPETSAKTSIEASGIDVRIYMPPKSSMQSGRAADGSWMLEYELPTARRPEPLMGWVASGDTLNSVRLRFDNRESAIAFADKNGWRWSLEEPHRAARDSAQLCR